MGVTGGSFTEVSCMGMPSEIEHLKPANNAYKNPFGTEIALFRTSEGGTARMGVSWDTPGAEGEMGRVRGERGAFSGGKYHGLEKNLPNTNRPPLPPCMDLGGHGGSHGPLTEEFIRAILQDRTPLVDVCAALNMTAAGIVAHQSALKDGELLKIPAVPTVIIVERSTPCRPIPDVGRPSRGSATRRGGAGSYHRRSIRFHRRPAA